MKNFSFKTIFFLACLAIAGYSFSSKLKRIEDKVDAVANNSKGFVISNIASHFEHHPEWDIAPTPELLTKVKVIMQQPYFWLAKGYQAYAFESQDGEYVLKFIQQQRFKNFALKKSPWNYFFDKEYKERMAAKFVHRLEIFLSAKQAFEEIPDETGMVYVHLNKTKEVHKKFKIIDLKGQLHKINADSASFLIQKKAHYVKPTLLNHISKGDMAGAKARIDQVFELVIMLAKKGFVDTDYALVRNNNIGFTKDRAICIDTGHIFKRPIPNMRKHMETECYRRLQPLYNWLVITNPELATYFDSQRVAIIASIPSTETQEIAQIAQPQ